MYVGCYKCKLCHAQFVAKKKGDVIWRLAGLNLDEIELRTIPNKTICYDDVNQEIPKTKMHACTNGDAIDGDGNVVGVAELIGIVPITLDYKGKYDKPGSLSSPKETQLSAVT